jgi:hypothetical protein
MRESIAIARGERKRAKIERGGENEGAGQSELHAHELDARHALWREVDGRRKSEHGSRASPDCEHRAGLVEVVLRSHGRRTGVHLPWTNTPTRNASRSRRTGLAADAPTFAGCVPRAHVVATLRARRAQRLHTSRVAPHFCDGRRRRRNIGPLDRRPVSAEVASRLALELPRSAAVLPFNTKSSRRSACANARRLHLHDRVRLKQFSEL